jgi:hypothetical protein
MTSVKLSWSITPRVGPEAEWNCAHSNQITSYTYEPDQWLMLVTNNANGASLYNTTGTQPAVTFSCIENPDSAPFAPTVTGSRVIDVSSATAGGDLTIRVETSVIAGGRTGVVSPYSGSDFFCPSGQPFAILPNVTWSSGCGAAARRAGAATDSGCPSLGFDLTEQVTTALTPWNTPPTARVLTHKYGTDDSYPSLNQLPASLPLFRFRGTVSPGSSSDPIDVWFRVTDPKDTAPYIVAAGDARVDDNRDPLNPKGILRSDACGGCSASGGSALNIKANGPFELLLQTTSQYAGDNYQILASFEPPNDDGTFPCEDPNTGDGCNRSGTITAWKRLYLENASMFRRGAFLAAAAPSGTSSLAVVDARSFRVGDAVAVVHADPILAPPASRRTYSEVRHIADIDEAQNVLFLGTIDGSGTIVPEQLKRDYSPAEMSPATGRAVPYLADAVGIVRGGTFDPSLDTQGQDFFYAEPRSVLSQEFPDPANPSLFNSSFIEYTVAQRAVPYVPLVRSMGEQSTITYEEQMFFAAKWFEHPALPNCQLLIGGLRDSEATRGGVTTVRSTRQPIPPPPARLGIRERPVTTDISVSYVYVGFLEGANRTASSLRLISEGVAHEIGHQWRVNATFNERNYDGHDKLRQWDRSGGVCQMNASTVGVPSFSDGHVAFHYLRRGNDIDSEYRWVRERCEPVPREYPSLAGDWWTLSEQPCN